MTTLREFKLHPAMLNSVIASQSGTPQKALLELVMNSVDAGAASIDIKVDNDTFRVADDGHGIESIEDLDAFWDTFGTPHEEGDVPFGTFRIGRGQIMSMAEVSFRTRRLEMRTDLTARPGIYDLVEHADDQPGMVVSGSWLPGLRRRAVAKATAAELKRLCRWVGADVKVNGSRVSTDPATKTWKEVTADAYFELGLDEPLRIYNLGAFVCEFPPSRYGVGGEVVSRRRLALNTARNEIMVSRCAVWESIEEVLDRQRGVALLRGVLTKESQRQAVLSMVARGEVALADVLDKPLVTLAGGAVTSLRELAQAKTLAISAPSDATRAERLNGHGTFVLSAASARVLGVRDAADVVGMLVERVAEEKEDTRLAGFHVANPRIVDVREEYEARVRVDLIRDATGDLKRDDQIRLAEITHAHTRLVKALQAFGWRHIGKRALLVSRLVGALAQTDGEDSIMVDSRYLTQCFSRPGGVIGLAQTLVHEYCHSHLKYEDQHDLDFYRTVHDACSDMGVLGAIWEMVSTVERSR